MGKDVWIAVRERPNLIFPTFIREGMEMVRGTMKPEEWGPPDFIIIH